MIELLQQIKPSFKVQIYRSWYEAKGVSWFRATGMSTYSGWPKCYLCGRQADYLYNFTTLVWQLRNGELVQVCLDHPKPNHPKDIVIDGLSYNELVDASTGLIVKLPPPSSVAYKRTRNAIRGAVLLLSYIPRFAWFFVRDLWLWNVAFPVVMWWRTLKS